MEVSEACQSPKPRRHTDGVGFSFPLTPPSFPPVKLALHRSLTFWSGILLMIFIGWAWRFSMTNTSGGGWGHFFIAQGAGGVEVSHHRDLHWGNDEFGISSQRKPSEVFIDEIKLNDGSRIEVITWTFVLDPPSAWAKPLSVASDGVFRAFVPHWLLLLAVALPWVALLVWRARRRRTSSAFS